MSNPIIAPPAQRLAEENNVDWRTLHGSGDGGSVVESDVLEYLARVMSGEEATNPTPEPVPEGMKAWLEEPVRSRADAPSEVAVPAAPPPKPDKGLASPWTLEVPEPVAQDEAEAPAVDDTFSEPQGVVAVVHDALLTPVVPEAVHVAVVAELTALKGRLEGLEEERLRHVGELRQLQETVALQKTDTAKLGALQSEVDTLRDELAHARTEARRVGELEAHSHELEGRLERARAFKDGAKTEFDGLSARNTALEAELAALKNRPWWKFWG